MTIQKPLFLPVSLFVLAVGARAQVQTSNPTSFQSVVGESYWGQLADDSYGAVWAGDFTGEGELDAVVLEGGFPMLLETPEAFYTSVYVDAPTNDAVVVAGRGGQDLLVTLGQGGLMRHRFDVLRGRFVSETLARGRWDGGVALASGDLDGDGRSDFAGAGLANPFEVALLFGNRATARQGVATSFSFRAGAATHDVFLLDWTGNGRDEVAVVTDLGLEVYTAFGGLIASAPMLSPDALGTVLELSGSARKRLAFVVPDPVGSGQEVVVIDDAGVEGPFALGNLGVVGIVAGDGDGDGDQELAFSVTSAPSVFLLENLTGGGAATFDPTRGMSEIAVGDPLRDPTDNRAGLASGDFDLDGDLDLLVPIQGDATGTSPRIGEIPSSVLLVRNGTVEERLLGVRVPGSKYYLDPGVSLDIEVQWSAPQNLLPTRPGQTLLLEVAFWHTSDLGMGTEPVPFLTASAALSAGAAGSFFFPTPHTDFTFTDLYSMVFRQVVRDANGELVAEGAAIKGIYSSPVQTAVLQSLAGVESFRSSQNAIVTGGGTSGDSINGGGITIGPNVPPFGSGNSPGK